MKKTKFFIIFLLLFLVVFFKESNVAFAEGKVEFYGDSVSGNVGEEVEVTITYRANQTISAGEILIVYEPQMLEYISISPGEREDAETLKWIVFRDGVTSVKIRFKISRGNKKFRIKYMSFYIFLSKKNIIL